ncbi:MAG: DNA-directed RNA polymerase subunit alpha [Candidatus Nomurabacteria bacterium]|jgi:DNA-directed RNA polymerase subunit alpha|nr:DNA-directed RNA polymerase subunit alpha [Candidatus Nomurabacteria bacterium]
MSTKLIHEPKLAEVIKNNQNSETFVIKALYNGYGHTLGNSLRRVLLSSIGGAAVVAFKIEGITHEFTTVKGVAEDAVDIMQNLKNIHFKKHTNLPVELHLSKKGAGEVKASDITLSADVEISNPDQRIATLDSDGVLEMDLVVENGVGYQTIEQSTEERLHSDMIALDAIFSPVLRVRYDVDDDRVGDDFSLQKLIMTIDTDGTISPKEAFEQAAAILVNQYQALAGATVVESVAAPETAEKPDNGWLATQVAELEGLSTRTVNALQDNHIRTLRDLIAKDEDELKKIKGFGSKAREEVEKLLEEYKNA